MSVIIRLFSYLNSTLKEFLGKKYHLSKLLLKKRDLSLQKILRLPISIIFIEEKRYSQKLNEFYLKNWFCVALRLK